MEQDLNIPRECFREVPWSFIYFLWLRYIAKISNGIPIRNTEKSSGIPNVARNP